MNYRQMQIKNLQMVIDQFLPGDYEINHARMNHEGEDLEWFELIKWTDISKKEHRCPMSSPTWSSFQDSVISMCATEIELAKEY